jgi:hypothetical protein
MVVAPRTRSACQLSCKLIRSLLGRYHLRYGGYTLACLRAPSAFHSFQVLSLLLVSTGVNFFSRCGIGVVAVRWKAPGRADVAVLFALPQPWACAARHVPAHQQVPQMALGLALLGGVLWFLIFMQEFVGHSRNFFWGGFYYSARQRSAPPEKPRTRPSRTPCAHGVRAPTAGATATPRRSSRWRTGRRDPRRRRTRHPSCLRRSLEHQTRQRATCSWPPPLCLPHISTRPLPTRAERTSAYQGGPVFGVV